MTKINKTTIVTSIATAVLGTSAITANFNTTASAAKTEKVSHHKLTKHEKEIKARKAAKAKAAAKKKALAKQKAKTKGKSNNNNNGTTNIKTIGPNFNDNNNSNKSDKIANGYNYTKDEVTDFNQYYQVFKQTELTKMNNYRQANGLQPLVNDNILDKVAMQRAQQNYNLINTSWFDGHDDQDGTAFVDKVAIQDGLYSSTTEADQHLSENATTGSLNEDGIQEDPITAANTAVQNWIDEGTDGGHYQNMMNNQTTKIGIGIYIGPNHGQQTNAAHVVDFSN